MKILITTTTLLWALAAPVTAQSIENKIIGLSDSSIRARIGDQPLDMSHSIYLGSYGKKQGVYVLQWFNDRVRGSFFDYTNNKEIRLYGDNSKPGRVIMEAWKSNAHNGTGLITKGSSPKGRISWNGTIHLTELVDFPVRMTKYTPRGPLSLNSTSTYHGKLGRTSIRVTLSWYGNGRVHGRYTNLNNSKSYDLMGYNFTNGRLYLDEWDPRLGDVESGAVTARISLRKVTVNGRVQWQGRMFNMDNRNFPMSFARSANTR